jgi:hypothetical protein
MEMPLDVHLGIFTCGPRRMLSQSRYAALLVSMHGWRLYARRDLDRTSREEAQAIRSFLDAQRAFQQELLKSLRGDSATAATAGEALVERNSLLIWTWDYLSLALCLEWNPATARGAPTADGRVDLELSRAGAGHWHLDPWPFSTGSLTIRCEGRRLGEDFDSEERLRQAFSDAPWEPLDMTLVPRR